LELRKKALQVDGQVISATRISPTALSMKVRAVGQEGSEVYQVKLCVERVMENRDILESILDALEILASKCARDPLQEILQHEHQRQQSKDVKRRRGPGVIIVANRSSGQGFWEVLREKGLRAPPTDVTGTSGSQASEVCHGNPGQSTYY